MKTEKQKQLNSMHQGDQYPSSSRLSSELLITLLPSVRGQESSNPLDIVHDGMLVSGGGNGHPFQYSCLENPMDRGAWQATVHGVTKSQTWLSMPAQKEQVNS